MKFDKNNDKNKKATSKLGRNLLKPSLGLLLATTLVMPAHATNGYWTHGYGPKSKSMAGACVAMSFGSMCAASNPASMALVGNRMEFGAALFSPHRGFTADNNAQTPPFASIPPGEYESDNELFLIPYFGYNRVLDENSSLGITVGANGGMNTEYNNAVFRNFGMGPFQASAPAGVDLKQMFVGVTYARKLDGGHSVGITPILALQAFEAYGLEPFKPFSKHPDKLTNNGTDYAYGGGLRAGWLWQATPELKIGASYQTRLWMSKFEEYKGLFAEEGDFDIPPNLDLGFSYKIRPELTFAFNYQKILFSDVKAVHNRADLVFSPALMGKGLGTDDGLGFGWDDVDVFKFGVQWEYNPEWTFRAGFSKASQPITATQSLFNTLAPAVVTKHFTFGFGKKFGPNRELNAAFTYAPNETVYGTNPNTGPQTGHLQMDQWEIEIGWTMQF